MVDVGISALTLVPGVVGGSETAYRALLRELHHHPDVRVQVYLPSLAPTAHEGHAYTVVRSYRASQGSAGRALAMGEALVAGGRIRREMRLDRVGLVHFPFGTMIPEIDAVPTVTTIHDMQHEALPELFSRSELAYRRLVYRRTAQRSTVVIAVSEHAANAISSHLDVPRARIRVIPQGVDLSAFTPGTGSREPYLLYPANPWPHKNHQRLFAAFAILRSRNPALRLILTGTGHDAARLPDGVESRGRVSTEDLVGLYQGAAALVFPSLYEGFGIPPLEAMATGCPVAASAASAIPEVVGDAAVLFDPMDPEAIAAGVEALLADPTSFVERGFARVERFSWARTADRHVELYRELSA